MFKQFNNLFVQISADYFIYSIYLIYAINELVFGVIQYTYKDIQSIEF